MPEITKVWTFTSSSNPDKTYETLQYEDGSTTCNCRGWTVKKKDRERSCTHTRKVDMGTADGVALSFHDYTQGKSKAKKIPKKTASVFDAPKKKTKSKVPASAPLRKIRWQDDA